MKHTQTRSISLPTRSISLGEGEQEKPVLSRQSLRRSGYFAILLELKRRYPNAPRSDLREAARICQKDAWTLRDKEAVRKLTHPKLPNA